jgi:aspartyl-tRNA(Asn)/glutamyl-tRNA(Gln) amidotransferase subunit B
MDWEIVIGLETHAQLNTASKIFSGASTAFGAPPNSQASAVDLALPGVLPVLNKGAVERAIRFGLAVQGEIARTSVFARKNYFYPDLPKGYQISQYERPVVSGGRVPFTLGGEERSVRLTRAHLEEDAGKSLHEDFHGMTGIDLNRAGTPLLEIVSEPDMRSAAEAVAYAKALHALVRWIDICDGNMQEGSFRCDANVSVRRPGQALGTRCEIKNLNSFRFLERAIELEARRQIELLEDGGRVLQETRLFDPERGETRPMRSKEEAQDYRYFPDPDLLPVEIAESWIESVRAEMPALPRELRAKFERQYGLSVYDAALLTESREKADFFEIVRSIVGRDPKTVAHWINGELSALVNDTGVDLPRLAFGPEQFALVIRRINEGAISARAGKEVLHALAAGEADVDAIVANRGLAQVSDTDVLAAAAEAAIAANAKLVADYRAGKEKAFNALVGKVMAATQGKANPARVGELLRKKLSSS